MPKKCPRCNADNGLSVVSCWQCYADLSEGQAAPAAAVAAPGFGSTELPPMSVEAPAAAPTGKRARAPKAPKAAAAPGGRKLPLVPIVVVLLLAGAGGGFFVLKGRGGGDPTPVVKEFYDAMSRKDWDAMAKCCTSGTAPAILKVKDQMSNPIMKLVFDSMKVENVQIGEVTTNGDSGSVKVKATVSISIMGRSRTDTQEQPVPVAREGGVWKVDASQVVAALQGGAR